MREDGTVADLANLEYEFMIYRMKDKNRGKVKNSQQGHGVANTRSVTKFKAFYDISKHT